MDNDNARLLADLTHKISSKAFNDDYSAFQLGAPRESLEAHYKGKAAKVIFEELLSVTNPPNNTPNPDRGCGRGYWCITTSKPIQFPSFDNLSKYPSCCVIFCGKWNSFYLSYNASKAKLNIRVGNKSPGWGADPPLCIDCNTLKINRMTDTYNQQKAREDQEQVEAERKKNARNEADFVAAVQSGAINCKH